MIIPKELLPEDVTQTCTVTHAGQRYFRPDIFWRAGLGALLGDQEIPAPDEFTNHQSVQRAREKADRLRSGITSLVEKHFKRRKNASEIAQMILEGNINSALRDFFSDAFPGYNEETFALYPSGILGVMIVIRALNDKAKDTSDHLSLSSLNGFCTTGDISVSGSQTRENPARLLHVNETSQVSLHDELRKTLGITAQQKDLPVIARYRGPMLGNLPFPSDTLIQIARHFGGIQTGSLWECRDGMAVAYSDGLILSGDTLRGRVNVSRQRGQTDYTASMLRRDPALAIIDRRLALGEEASLPTQSRVRRPDDGVYLMIGDPPRFDKSTFEPVF